MTDEVNKVTQSKHRDNERKNVVVLDFQDRFRHIPRKISQVEALIADCRREEAKSEETGG